ADDVTMTTIALRLELGGNVRTETPRAITGEGTRETRPSRFVAPRGESARGASCVAASVPA
ncbi:MAG TPA: hypothetical protein VH482_30410, partial [Thermomicrobiales bacterium]